MDTRFGVTQKTARPNPRIVDEKAKEVIEAPGVDVTLLSECGDTGQEGMD